LPTIFAIVVKVWLLTQELVVWGRQSCRQPVFSRLDPLESRSAAWIGCPTIEPGLFTHHGNTTLGDRVTVRPVGIGIEPDGVQFGYLHSRVDNRPAHPAVAAD